jgi:zona occludens toxin
MIELHTGINGSGKTLSMVQRLSEAQARWEKHPDESRSVFVSGIHDLTLPCSPVPLKSVQLTRAAAPILVPDWDAMPYGSLVIIDESQRCFPPRSSASSAPEQVEWLNTHRFHGFDVWLITQHPKLIDHGVRALVGRHQHFRRVFGGQRSIVYEWDSCSDSLTGTKQAVKSYFAFPKNIYKFYKSAEIHTKQKFKLPAWILIPLIGVLIGVYAVPRAYAVLSHGVSGKGIKLDEDLPIKNEAGLVVVPKLKPPLETFVQASSAVSAPLISVPLPTPASSELTMISACLASQTKCQCYSHDGIRLIMTDMDCRAAARSPDGRFRFDLARR